MKMHGLCQRLIAMFLTVMLLVFSIPTVPVSAAVAGGQFEETKLDIVTEKTSTLATGVTQNLYTVLDKNGDQVKIYTSTMDMNVDTVKFFTSYKDMDNTSYGVSKLTEQVSAFKEKAQNGDEYYNGTVVVGIKASYYNMANGKSTGTFVMNGNDVTTESEGNRYGYFAVMKDGSVKIGKPGEYSSDKGNIQEAISIYHMLITDGNIVSGLNDTDKYPRQTIGITADNQVILMTADGNQSPTSVGLTMAEQARVMADLGCVWAGHLDGGGSATYGSKAEGTDTFKIVNSPSGGSERSVSNGLLVVSQEEQTNEFVRIAFDAENDYVTPGTSIKVTAKGVSSSGGSADIPEDVTYSVTGGIYENGIFTAADETGTSVIAAHYMGEIVGTAEINVVIPNQIAFKNAVFTVPNGKTITIKPIAKYGSHTVMIQESDISFTLGDASAGTFDGFEFTACDEDTEVSDCTITATVKKTDINAEAQLVIGKASEVVRDFEDGTLGGLSITTGNPEYGPSGANGQNEIGNLQIVTAENGKVHDGDYALAVECDFTQLYETGYHMLKMTGLDITVPAKATSIGMWIYLPELEELSTTSMRFVGTNLSTNETVKSPWLWESCAPYGWENDGWHYFSMDISGCNDKITFTTLEIYICDRDNADVGFYFKDNASVNSKFTFYFDNITVDYSAAIEDREPPVFSDITYQSSTMSEAQKLDAQTIGDNTVHFSACVNEDTEKNNAAGLDNSSAKAYIDGVEVDCTYADGLISTEKEVLADGVHTIRFEMSDKMGNMAYVTGQINIDAESDMPTISIEPADPDADKILIGSLYWVNVVASDMDKVSNVTMKLNLNSVSQWELEHMNVAEGFRASSTVDKVTNNATITISGKSIASGGGILAQLPIRTWESRLSSYSGYEDQTPEKLWSRKIIWPIDIKLRANLGEVQFTDGSTGSFSMTPMNVITELYGNYAELDANGDYANKTSWHVHTEEAKEDGCYTGRTFCAVCNSVVKWGTTHHDMTHHPATSATCTEDGNYEYWTCSKEDGVYYKDENGTEKFESLADTVIGALGHTDSDNDGICDKEECKAYIDGIGAKLVGYTLSLNGNIAVDFHMELSDDIVKDEGAYAYITYERGENTLNKTIYVKDILNETKEVNGKTYYVFSCEVSAKDMTGDISITMHTSDNREGNTYHYTVKEYADYMISHTDTYSEEAVAFAKAIVNYGAYAQIYFDNNTNKLANASLDEADQNVAEVTLDTFDHYKPVINNNEAVGKFVSGNLSLKTETTVNVLFKAADGVEASKLIFKVGDTVLDQPDIRRINGKDYYCISVDNIKAPDLDEVYSFTVTDGINTSTMDYGAFSYAYTVMKSDRYGALKDVTRALWYLNQTAEAYRQTVSS